MTAIKETIETNERCILVGMVRRGQSRWEVEDHLAELEDLAQTSGAEPIRTFIQERPVPDPAFFVGKGKIEEIHDFILENRIDLIIFDDELSPAQARNIEKITGIKVLDRTGLILDIFALHARTNMAKVQVELAQLNYILPRLTRQWQHLSRQVGGIGTKGPGETQLETDRRLVRRRNRPFKRKTKTNLSSKRGTASATLRFIPGRTYWLHKCGQIYLNESPDRCRGWH
jgi:GTP-binding protein HflX